MAKTHTIEREDVERVATLARLSLPPARVESLRDELAHILELVGLLDELDTDGIEASAHPLSPRTPLRDDVVTPSVDREEVLAQAPGGSRDGGFSVPKVLEVEG